MFIAERKQPAPSAVPCVQAKLTAFFASGGHLERALYWSEAGTGLPDGLTYRDEFVSAAEAAAIMKFIDAQPWVATIYTRRVQEYGYTYHTSPAVANAGAATTPIPPAFSTLCARLVERGLMTRPPDQMIINEYTVGQGIGDHVDHVGQFADEIVSLSLLSDVVMSFHPARTAAAAAAADTPVHLLLRANSALALRGPARYEWTHGIAKRTSDVIGLRAGTKPVPRARRVSLTFRHMRHGGTSAASTSITPPAKQ